MRTFRCILLLLLSNVITAAAQEVQTDSVKTISSVDVRVDIAGPLMESFGLGYSQYEAAARVGLKNRYFPVFELGYGTSDYTGETTNISSKVSAPYFRTGIDYNFTKPNHLDSRFYAGLRYGFSVYKYDLCDPGFGDAVWNHYEPFKVESASGSAHWMELVAGVETRLWSIVHIGWCFRYKFRLSEHGDELGSPWYVPGFGENGKKTWGANFHLIFEI